ncbi:MAG: TauD/TfdA family dioxygenase [Deltaproteobacteria bacterium]|nr:TauD/TfdA family dioxygenase [Deltaproteobacteria bacterium]
MPSYLSYAEQSLHYFARPHEEPRVTALAGPAAWRGPELSPELRGKRDWRTRLNDAQVSELDRALAAARASGKPTAELTAADFPLPTLAAELARWRSEIEHGRGFLVVSGLPVKRWSRDDCERFFWCLGLHMGRPGAQNPQGDLLGHVTDTGDDDDDPWVRLYRTRADIAYHCDAADVVGLLCLRAAPRGGASRIVSSVTVYNELLARRPDLVARLYEPFAVDVRNEDASGEIRHLPIAPCRYSEGRLRTFYHSDYFRSAQRHDDVAPFSEDERALLDTYESIACDPKLYLDMQLEPGDIQWLSNHVILHARTAYEDHEEPERKRHLLRLWLSTGS